MGIRTKLKDYFQRKKFFRKHKGVFCSSDLQLRLPQYIQTGENVFLGWGGKLLCWDAYNGKCFTQKPRISIGDRFHATRNFTVQCANRIEIGNDVLVASDVFIIDYDHGKSPLTKSYLENPLEISDGITIEDGVWIGNNVVILGGVVIGKKSIVAAGSVLSPHSVIPPYCIVAGNPAKVIKQFDFNKNEWVRSDKR